MKEYYILTNLIEFDLPPISPYSLLAIRAAELSVQNCDKTKRASNETLLNWSQTDRYTQTTLSGKSITVKQIHIYPSG